MQAKIPHLQKFQTFHLPAIAIFSSNPNLLPLQRRFFLLVSNLNALGLRLAWLLLIHYQPLILSTAEVHPNVVWSERGLGVDKGGCCADQTKNKSIEHHVDANAGARAGKNA